MSSEADRLNATTNQIVGAAIDAHRALGPGVLQSSVHTAQLLSRLRFAKCKVGLLINFNVKRLLERGLKRVVNRFPE
jgi:PD-(D/E)XK nuclease superfamily